MSRSDRIALIVIAISLLILSPMNIANMALDGILWRTYVSLMCGWSWLLVFISWGIILFVCLYDDNGHMNK